MNEENIQEQENILTEEAVDNANSIEELDALISGERQEEDNIDESANEPTKKPVKDAVEEEQSDAADADGQEETVDLDTLKSEFDKLKRHNNRS